MLFFQSATGGLPASRNARETLAGFPLTLGFRFIPNFARAPFKSNDIANTNRIELDAEVVQFVFGALILANSSLLRI